MNDISTDILVIEAAYLVQLLRYHQRRKKCNTHYKGDESIRGNTIWAQEALYKGNQDSALKFSKIFLRQATTTIISLQLTTYLN